MMKITGLSHLFKWENLHNWWLTKYFFAPLYVFAQFHVQISLLHNFMNIYIHIQLCKVFIQSQLVYV